ncbi:MAG: hypothetical protein AAF614_27400 [Chloroflexota bacterium]
MSDPSPTPATQLPTVPSQQKEIAFFNASIVTAFLVDGQVYASINSMCDALELDRRGQRRRIDRNEVLVARQRVVVMSTLPHYLQSTSRIPQPSEPDICDDVKQVEKEENV